MRNFRRLRGLAPRLRGLVGWALIASFGAAAEAQPIGGTFGSGVGALSADGKRSSLPYTVTALGVLVALRPIVDTLGGELVVGPLKQSHTLKLFGEEIILGPDSAVITVGEEIVPLSRQPLLGAAGELEVPLDFLDRSYGDHLGYRFRWDRSDQELRASRQARKRLPIRLDMVQISATTTLVIQFSESPRYRVVEGRDKVEIVMLGDWVELRGRLPRPDSLVEQVDVERDRIVVKLSPQAQAAAPYELTRGSRTQLVLDVSRRRFTVREPTRTLGSERTGWQGMKIVVDPGHGGRDVGAVGHSGTLEKDLTFQLARTLKRRLEAKLPVQVILTRDADISLDQETRTSIANQHQADLFVSIHLNSEPVGGTARGAETYFASSTATDSAAAAAADFENRAGGQTRSSDLDLMLWDLAQSRHLAQSQRLAKMVQDELNLTLGLRNRGVKQAPFRVLRGATMPAILVEFGFLSNEEEEAKLLDPAHRVRLVDSLVEAVARYRAALRGAEPAPADIGSRGVRP